MGRLLSEVSSREISEWMAFLALEDENEQEKKRKENFDRMQGMFPGAGKGKKFRLKDIKARGKDGSY